MKLFTELQTQQLQHNGQLANRDNDHAPVVKLFLPGTACTWLLSELDYEEPDIAFGLCDLGFGCPELGSVSLKELSSTDAPFLSLPVERDIHFNAQYPMSVYAEAARMCQAITEDETLLQQAAIKLKKSKVQPG